MPYNSTHITLDKHSAVEIILFSNTLKKHINIKTGSEYFMKYWKLLQYILWLIRTINCPDVHNLQQHYSTFYTTYCD